MTGKALREMETISIVLKKEGNGSFSVFSQFWFKKVEYDHLNQGTNQHDELDIEYNCIENILID
jgi:hypothetical protein